MSLERHIHCAYTNGKFKTTGFVTAHRWLNHTSVDQMLRCLYPAPIANISPLSLWPNGRYLPAEIQMHFLHKDICILFEISLKVAPSVRFTIRQHWSSWWLRAEQVTKQYLNQCWPGLLMHICVNREIMGNVPHQGLLAYVCGTRSFPFWWLVNVIKWSSRELLRL